MTWCETKKLKRLQKKFGKSKQENFSIKDTIPIPHPYMITPKHLEFNDSMYLGKEQIDKMESKHGSLCGQRIKTGFHTETCNLKYEEHKQGLLILCEKPMSDPKDKNKFNKELHSYLLEIKENLDLKKYDGFGFVDKNGNGSK